MFSFLKCWDEIWGLLCASGLFFFLKKPTRQNNLSDVEAVKSHREKHNRPCLLSLLLTHRHLYQNSSCSRNRKQRLIRRGKTHLEMLQWSNSNVLERGAICYGKNKITMWQWRIKIPKSYWNYAGFLLLCPPVTNLVNPLGSSLCRDNFSHYLEGKFIHLQKGMWWWSIYVWKGNKESTGPSIFKGENSKNFHTTTYRPGQCLLGMWGGGGRGNHSFHGFQKCRQNSMIYFKIPNRIVILQEKGPISKWSCKC